VVKGGANREYPKPWNDKAKKAVKDEKKSG
jgi:hypothetical protein